MTTARDIILGRISNSLGRHADDGGAEIVKQRLTHPTVNLMPARGQLPPAKRRDLFIKMARAADATVERVLGINEVPTAVTAYLRDHNLPAQAVRTPDQALDAVPWSRARTLELRAGPAVPEDDTAITSAFAAVAETGTLIMTSGATSPTTLNFLPENHICVLWVDQIAGVYEEVWARLRGARSTGDGTYAMPRTLNMVTGPSRSADIEQTLQLGAHGPRRLHVILVNGHQP